MTGQLTLQTSKSFCTMHVNQASQYRWFSKINAGEQINHILRDRASEGDTNSD